MHGPRDTIVRIFAESKGLKGKVQKRKAADELDQPSSLLLAPPPANGISTKAAKKARKKQQDAEDAMNPPNAMQGLQEDMNGHSTSADKPVQVGQPVKVSSACVKPYRLSFDTPFLL